MLEPERGGLALGTSSSCVTVRQRQPGQALALDFGEVGLNYFGVGGSAGWRSFEDSFSAKLNLLPVASDEHEADRQARAGAGKAQSGFATSSNSAAHAESGTGVPDGGSFTSRPTWHHARISTC